MSRKLKIYVAILLKMKNLTNIRFGPGFLRLRIKEICTFSIIGIVTVGTTLLITNNQDYNDYDEEDTTDYSNYCP